MADKHCMLATAGRIHLHTICLGPIAVSTFLNLFGIRETQDIYLQKESAQRPQE